MEAVIVFCSSGEFLRPGGAAGMFDAHVEVNRQMWEQGINFDVVISSFDACEHNYKLHS